MSLGSKLKSLRLKKGVSLQSVANSVNVSKTHVWGLENENTKNPSFELIKNLANYYGVSMDFLANEFTEEAASPEIQAFARELSLKNVSVKDIDFLRANLKALKEWK